MSGTDDSARSGPTDAALLRILDAIKELDRDNPEHFTQQGIPRVGAIEGVMGEDVEAHERDKAWSMIKAA